MQSAPRWVQQVRSEERGVRCQFSMMTRNRGRGEGATTIGDRYTCVNRVIGKIKNFALVMGKNKKNLNILLLKRVKFEFSFNKKN